MSSVAMLRLIVACACFVSVYQAFVFHLRSTTSVQFDLTWMAVFGIFIAIWVDKDSRSHPEIAKPSFDFGFFVILFWPVYLPYYLVRTRGPAGWLWILAFAVVVLLDWILQWAVYWLGG